jgi:RNA polymerase sigma-70 factor (ECF subfamily)
LDDFDEFYLATRQRVLRAVSVIAEAPEDAQDCVQEAYVRALVRWQRIRSYDSPEAWVRRVAMNLAFDGHRRRRARRLLLNQSPAPSPPRPPSDATLEVVRAIRRLPRPQQEVVVLHDLLDRKLEEVAHDLGRPLSTVKTQLSRARAGLQASLISDGSGKGVS